MAASWTCVETCIGWPNGLASFLTSTCKPKKNQLKADISCITLANNRLMDVTQLALTWVVWPNDEKLELTCVQIWSWPKWAQVNASVRKAWPNGVASRPQFSTCVYLWLRLARALRYIVHVRVKNKLKWLLQTWSNGFSKSWKSPSSSQFLKNLVGVGVWSKRRSDKKMLNTGITLCKFPTSKNKWRYSKI